MLPIKLNIDGVSAEHPLGDLALVVKDEYRQLVYIQKPEPSQVPISYIGMPEPSVENINIVDTNESPTGIVVLANSYRQRFQKRFNGKVFDLPVKQALITDVTNTDLNGTPIPLFYKHVITDNFDTRPEILDQNMNRVSGLSYRIEVGVSVVAVYHNLEPVIDLVNRSCTAYYIRYRKNTGEQIFSLLQNEPAYSKATIEDGLDRWKRTYAVRELNGNYRYRILYQGGGPFFVKHEPDYQLKIRKPDTALPNDPWLLRITDGELQASNGVTIEKYHIPEYHFQAFAAIEPDMLIPVSECTVLDSHRAKTPYGNLLVDEDHVLDVLVCDETFKPKWGWTTGSGDRFWADRFSRWGAQNEIRIFPLSSASLAGLSYNTKTGLLHIPKEIETTDKVFVKGFREAYDYTYYGIDVNPLHNRLMLDHRAIIYCLPDSELGFLDTAIHHLLIDDDGEIVSWSDEENLSVGGSGTTILPGLVGDVNDTGYQKFLDMFPKNLILGSVSITHESNINDLAFIDVRENGGGLTDDAEANLPTLLHEYPEMQWFSDESLAGRSVPALGAMVVDLPFEVLEEAGGIFPRAEVHERVLRHMAAGSLPIIRYYADLPDILAVSYDTVSQELTVHFSEVDHADSYRLYAAESNYAGTFISSVLTTAASNLIPEAVMATVTVSSTSGDYGFDPTTELHFFITPVANNTEWPSSKLASLTLSDLGGMAVQNLNAIIVSCPTFTSTLNAIIVEE